MISFTIPEGGDLALLNKQLLDENRPLPNFEVGHPVFLHGEEGRPVRDGAEGFPMGPEGVTRMGPEGLPRMGPEGVPRMGPEGVPRMGPEGVPRMGPEGVPRMGPEGRPVVSEGAPIRYGAEGVPLVPVPPGTTVPCGAAGQPIAPMGPEGQPIRYGAEGKPTVSMGPEDKPLRIDSRGPTSPAGQVAGNFTEEVAIVPEREGVHYAADGKPVDPASSSGEKIEAVGRPIVSKEPEEKPILGEGSSSVPNEPDSKPIAVAVVGSPVVSANVAESSIEQGTDSRPLVVKPPAEAKQVLASPECALTKDLGIDGNTESASSEGSL